jgi:carboxyl-terminal processing protease
MERKVLFALLVGLVVLMAALVTQGLLSTAGANNQKPQDQTQSQTPSSSQTSSATAAAKTKTDFNLLKEVYQKMKDNFYQPDRVQDPSTLEEASIRGLVSTLKDPYTRFNTPKEYNDFTGSLNGDYEGIGAYIELRDNQIVANPIKGGPAEQSGVRSGDVILTIDGEKADGLSTTEASSRLRGKKGTQVKIQVLHKDGDKEEITITRDEIHVPSVESAVVDGDIGKITINRFGDTTASEVERALKSLDDAAAPKKLTGLILDLRGNGGGYLSAAERIGSLFVDQGGVLLIEKQRSSEMDDKSFGNNRPNLPIAILMDEGTASASEILSGAIRDNHMGILIGRNSFGKGVIQTSLPLSDGSQLIITTAEYLTPGKHTVQGVGLAPAKGFHVDSWADSINEISDEMKTFGVSLETIGLSHGATTTQSGSAAIEPMAADVVLKSFGKLFNDLAQDARQDDYQGAMGVLQQIREKIHTDPVKLISDSKVDSTQAEKDRFALLFGGFVYTFQPQLEKLQQRLEHNDIATALDWLHSPGIAGTTCPCKSPDDPIPTTANANEDQNSK